METHKNLVLLMLSLLSLIVNTVYAEGKAEKPVIAEQIVAVVNKQVIFLSDLTRYQRFFEEGGGQESTRLRTSVEKRVHHQLLLFEAKRFGLETPSEEAVDLEIETVQKRFQDRIHFENALKEAGITLDELRTEALNQLWVSRLITDRISFFIFVTDENVQQYYQQHQAEFEQSGQSIKTVEGAIRKILEKEKEAAKLKEYLSRVVSEAQIEFHIQ
ncbi:MAG: hypothetical protein AAB317_04200 [Nitrospirota bacterium]